MASSDWLTENELRSTRRGVVNCLLLAGNRVNCTRIIGRADGENFIADM